MATPPNGMRKKSKAAKTGREVSTAKQLSGLCKRAIQAFESHPGTGMMVEYTHIPEGIVDTVMPHHFKVDVSAVEHEKMMSATQKYSKVRSAQATEVGAGYEYRTI